MEGTAATSIAPEKVAGKISSAGQPQRADMASIRNAANSSISTDDNNPDKNTNNQQGQSASATDDKKIVDDTKGSGPDSAKKDQQPAVVDEAAIKEFYKKQGIDLPDTETLKAKLTQPIAQKEKTDAEKKGDEIKIKKRMLDIHLAAGASIEDFAKIESLAAAEAKELGTRRLYEELTGEGFTKEQADAAVKKLLMQFDENDIKDLNLTEDQIAQLKKEAQFAIKRTERRGNNIKKTAQKYLDDLKSEVLSQDEEAERAAKLSSKVEEVLSKLNRKTVHQLGEYEGQKLDPVEDEIPDSVVEEVKAILADPAKLKKTLFTDDGQLNLDFLVPHLINSVSRGTSVKHAYLTAQTRTIDKFKSTYGSVIPGLGSGEKRTDGRKGHIVSAGQPEKVRFNQ